MKRRWLAVGLVWVWLPVAHLVKHLLGLADTLHPNSYLSIAALAAISLATCLLGVAVGVGVGRL